MADRHLSMSKSKGKSKRDGDFDEEDVWSLGNNQRDEEEEEEEEEVKGTFSLSPTKQRNFFKGYSSSSSSSSVSGSAWQFSTTPRMIPRGSHENKVVTVHQKKKKQQQQQSAPMNIPDWPKIYGKKDSKKKCSNFLNVDGVHAVVNDDDDDDDENDDDELIPPHEWIAKKLARSQISSFSVCEGIGRTLKGRDLSKVRNAILSKTGFLED